MLTDKKQNDAQTILDAGLALGDVRKTSEGREFVILPPESTVFDLEKFSKNPSRAKASVDLSELDSFVRYVKTFGGGATRIFAAVNLETGSAVFVGVLDYHEGGKDGAAGWGAHRVSYRAAQTPEWVAWTKHNKRSMGQAEFAGFIEDNLEAIVSPAGAAMLEVAKTLEAKTSVEFKSGIRLENGDHHLKWTTETTGRAGGNGEMEIPGTFDLGVAPYQGGPAYKITARLRYRIEEGHLRLWYELVNPHKVIEASTKEMVETIKAQTDQDVFVGAAPAMNDR